MHNFYLKNFIFAALAVMLCFVILGASFIAVGRNMTIMERRSAIENNAEELSKLASAYSRANELSSWDFQIMLSALAQCTGSQCFICDSSGKVISCSDPILDCTHIGNTVDSQILTKLATAGGYNALTTLGGFYKDNCYVSARVISNYLGETEGYAFVAANASNMIRIWHRLLNVFLITALLILTTTLIISFLNSRRQAKPVNEMSAAAERIAHGDFSARVDVNGEDELGALAATFNKMAASLEQSEKRRSDFLANVAHELKTPMTTISGFADGILDGTIPRDSERKYLETISSETKRLNRLVRRMLDVSRLQQAGPDELRKNSFDAVELLLQTLIVFEKKINDKHLEVNAMVPEDSIIVLGEADSINQVIYNLLENAVKFATPGTELGIGIFKQDGKAYISVKNHGDTIPPEELPLIFDRFHKTDRSRSIDRDGVGLGLYIVKSILNNHGEDIVVTSKDGVTEFVFSLTLKSGK